jgi:hypothetical protein
MDVIDTAYAPLSKIRLISILLIISVGSAAVKGAAAG